MDTPKCGGLKLSADYYEEDSKRIRRKQSPKTTVYIRGALPRWLEYGVQKKLHSEKDIAYHLLTR